MQSLNKISGAQTQSISEAIKFIRAQKMMKFDETIEASFNISTKAPVSIRGFIKAPNRLNRKVKIAAFTSKNVGTDYHGTEDLVERFLKENINCDICLSDHATLPIVARKIGKILGRKRMMPDAKFGTVSDEIESLVEDINHGVMFFRNDKPGRKSVVHAIFGKTSINDADLETNFIALLKKISSVLPEKSSIESAHISKTMGKSCRVDTKGLI